MGFLVFALYSTSLVLTWHFLFCEFLCSFTFRSNSLASGSLYGFLSSPHVRRRRSVIAGSATSPFQSSACAVSYSVRGYLFLVKGCPCIHIPYHNCFRVFSFHYMISLSLILGSKALINNVKSSIQHVIEHPVLYSRYNSGTPKD